MHLLVVVSRIPVQPHYPDPRPIIDISFRLQINNCIDSQFLNFFTCTLLVMRFCLIILVLSDITCINISSRYLYPYMKKCVSSTSETYYMAKKIAGET